MSVIAAVIAWTIALALFIPALMLTLETAASFAPQRRRAGKTVAAPPVSVIVPAHNESVHLKATLGDLRGQLRDGDRLIVIADNCTDDTAAIARACGAEVFERHEPDRRGKGHALQFAIDRLRDTPPELVAFFDADCRLAPGTLSRLVSIAADTGRPAQALNLMVAPEGASPRLAIAAFAWIMINQVRMSGLSRLADVTRFTGLGMVAPWSAVSDLNFTAGGIAEDLALSFEFIRRDAAPIFAPDAKVTSVFPEGGASAAAQRARWERGSLGVLSRLAVPALVRGLSAMDVKTVLFALDALIPPLALFAVLLIGAAILTLVTAPLAGPGPVLLVAAALTAYSLSILCAWLAYGRKALPPEQLAGLAPFLLQKLRIYGREGRASSQTWTRTDRGGSPEGE